MNSTILSAKTAQPTVSRETTLPSPHTVEEITEALSATKALSRKSRIAVAAYYQAERRGFVPGGEQEDWLAAERDVG